MIYDAIEEAQTLLDRGCALIDAQTVGTLLAIISLQEADLSTLRFAAGQKTKVDVHYTQCDTRWCAVAVLDELDDHHTVGVTASAPTLGGCRTNIRKAIGQFWGSKVAAAVAVFSETGV